MAAGIITKGTQEVDLSQVRAERLNEVELAVSALPEHKVAQPLLPRSADHQVGIGLTSGVEVITDQLRCQNLGERIKRSPFFVVLVHNAAHCVCDLSSTSIADGKVDVQAGVLAGPHRRSGEFGNQVLRKTVSRTDVLNPPVPKAGKVFGEVPDYKKQLVEFISRTPTEIVGRKKIQSCCRDAEVVAPNQELTKFRCSGTMPVRCRFKKPLAGPPPVSIQDHRDMPGKLLVREVTADSALVDPVENASSDRNLPLCHILTLVHHR